MILISEFKRDIPEENLSEVSTTISVENNENNNSDTENETNLDQDNQEPPLEELINLNISSILILLKLIYIISFIYIY